MKEEQSHLQDLACLAVLLLALLLPTLLTAASSKLTFSSSYSSPSLLVVFLVASCLAGSTGVVCMYRHGCSLLDKVESKLPLSGLLRVQVFSRSMLSTITSVILIVRCLGLARADEETVNTSGILFFMLSTVSKFVAATILPPITHLGPLVFRTNISIELIEGLECGVDSICILLSATALICCRTQHVIGHLVLPRLNDTKLNRDHSRYLPALLLLLLCRASLALAALNTARIRKSSVLPGPSSLLAQDLFCVVHGLLLPLLLAATTPALRRLLYALATSTELQVIDDQEEMELNETPEEIHRPSSAPTRPSSALTKVETLTRPLYQSNLRKHHSALETVVDAPRRRKRRRVGGGPLDGVMLDMVGEKVIPLEESEEEESSTTCKTM